MDSRFAHNRRQFAALGLSLRRTADGFAVNYRHGVAETALDAGDIPEALECARYLIRTRKRLETGLISLGVPADKAARDVAAFLQAGV